ncbi:MAG TPA: ABC transporter permease [Gemmata sp.]|jgi:putative ABC transport system permease protein|nr:ABC transporter permease [Gemmata sp.]
MNLFDLMVISLRTLGKNKLRSGLTILGVVIGIAAVTTMVSLGQSGSQLVQDQFQTLGSNVIIVLPASSQTGGVRSGTVTTLTEADAHAIAAECPSVLAVSPFIGTSGQVIGGNVNWQPDQMLGVGPDYPLVRSSPLANGDFFTEREIVAAAKVCVLGYTVARQLFPDADPVGQQVRVKNLPFIVIGVLARKGANLVGQDQDNVLLMPYTTVRKRLQNSAFANIDLIFVSARSDILSLSAEKEINSLLMERHRLPPGEKPDFEVRNTAEVASVMNAIMGGLAAMLTGIAAISLVVGGVGIMNIMLVSVTERTREIGIRMALGARPRDILRQFLVESAVLSSIGGAIGLALGVGASAGIIALLNTLLPTAKWTFQVSIPAAVIALIFSAGVGIFFGFYPARRASRLDPIEALRYD